MWRTPHDDVANATQLHGKCHTTGWQMPHDCLANATQHHGLRHENHTAYLKRTKTLKPATFPIEDTTYRQGPYMVLQKEQKKL